MNADDLNPYQTSDTPLAAYLLMKGMVVLATVPDKHDSKRRIYVFVDEPERDRYEAEFKEDVGGYWSYWISLKTVQRKLHEGK